MSIYCSLSDIGHEHSTRCKRVRKIRHKVYEQDDSKPCTCGSSPIRYQGSHILPSNRDERGGHIDLAAIPPHITRDGRDDKPEKGQWHPWLRIGVASGEQDCGRTVILTRKQVENLRDTLSEWLRDS